VESPSATLSVVIPVYRGAETLARVVDELIETMDRQEGLELVEVILVHDGAVDDSARVITTLAVEHGRVTPVWLTRNFGQHAATLAGCSSTVGDWIVTMDEDGLHDPASIADMHDEAVRTGASLVYAHSQHHPHRRWRSLTSRSAKAVVRALFGVRGAEDFSSFRLLDGSTTRALAAYCGPGVYLDVALQWVFDRAVRVETTFREEYRPSSNYSMRTLVSHFRRMVLTAGTRPLRIASVLGFVIAALGVVAALLLVVGRLSGAIDVQGWTSVMVALSILLGAVLLVLGIIAEYLSMALTAVSGRPPYLIDGRPPRRPGSR
jgi:glycosyltransferase involved in cell wall biosynthesis